MNSPDPRDAALFSALPLVCMPRYGVLEEISAGGSRLLLGRDGLYLEARSNVLHACVLAAPMAGLPYGVVTPFVRAVQLESARQFLIRAPKDARVALPNEWAGVIAQVNGEMQLVIPVTESKGPGHIRYRAPEINPLDILVDVHSHGTSHAYFSQTDDADDLAMPSPVFIAAVVGCVDRADPEYAHRGVILGREFNLETASCIRHLGLEPRTLAASEA